MDKKSCKFCLKIIGDDFQAIEEILIGYMDELLLKLSPSISKQTVMCSECASILQAFFNFKNTVCYMEDNAPLNDLKEDFKLNLEDTENSSNVNMMLESNDQTSCYFCMKFIEREGLISLYESKEDMFMLDKLKKHISELISNNAELLACEACVDSLRRVLSFIMNCLDVKKEITAYNTAEGVDDKVQIQFKLKSLRNEDDCCNIIEIEEECCYKDQKEFSMGSDTEMKCEQIDNLDMTLKTEDVWIKSELSDSNSSQDSPMDHGKVDLGLHEITHETSSLTTHPCQMCPYKTNHKGYLNRHMRIHRSRPKKKTILKCNMCTYETEYRTTFKYHLGTHKNPSNITLYKCKICNYEGKNNILLKIHMKRHENPPKVTTYRCDICTYKSNRKRNVKGHMLSHKDASEVTMYKCEKCTFETKHKTNLSRHLLLHQNPSEASKYKCKICKFEAKYNLDLKRHMMTHGKS